MRKEGLRVIVSIDVRRKDLEGLLGMMRDTHPLHIDEPEADGGKLADMLSWGWQIKVSSDMRGWEPHCAFDAQDLRKAIAKRVRKGAVPIGDPQFGEADAEDILKRTSRSALARLRKRLEKEPKGDKGIGYADGE
jgi:hypothetical protein